MWKYQTVELERENISKLALCANIKDPFWKRSLQILIGLMFEKNTARATNHSKFQERDFY